MGNLSTLSTGDDWPAHYRGFRLQISANRTVWWQLYNGTDRLQLDPTLESIVDNFLELKPGGGRIHITESSDVLTRLDEGNRDYRDVYVGEVDLCGKLVPPESPEFSIDLQPEGLNAGDLWPGVYDGSRYSFLEQRVWWQNGETKRRHMVDGEFAPNILQTLNRYKSQGGSFRITPWGDVITLIPMHPSPDQVREQFDALPRVTQNIIKLRKERGVEMLPIYVGTIDDPSITVKEPRDLTDDLTDEEQEALSSWAGDLGRTSSTSPASHKAKTSSSTDDDDTSSSQEEGSEDDGEPDEDELPVYDDDPLDWIRKEINNEERS